MGMDHGIVKNAIGGLDEILSNARRALFEIGRGEFSKRGYYYSYDGSGYEEPHMALAGFLEEIYDSLLVILEAAQMPEAKASLIAAWPNSLQCATSYHTPISMKSTSVARVQRSPMSIGLSLRSG
jgi:hypothetical protein